MAIAVDHQRLKTPVGMCKVGTVLLGVIILGVGLHSHYDSSWKHFGLYRFCERPEVTKCPNISMERYYVAMVIASFVLSLIGLVAMVTLPDFSKRAVLNKVDLGYHGVAAGLLLIAAVVYIVSAQQINNLFVNPPNLRQMLNLRYGEKMAAGILTGLQGVLYGITAMQLVRNRAPDA